METVDIVGVGALCVGVLVLVIVVLTLRSAKSVIRLAEAHNGASA
jgi:hypothetical protein